MQSLLKKLHSISAAPVAFNEPLALAAFTWAAHIAHPQQGPPHLIAVEDGGGEAVEVVVHEDGMAAGLLGPRAQHHLHVARVHHLRRARGPKGRTLTHSLTHLHACMGRSSTVTASAGGSSTKQHMQFAQVLKSSACAASRTAPSVREGRGQNGGRPHHCKLHCTAAAPPPPPAPRLLLHLHRTCTALLRSTSSTTWRNSVATSSCADSTLSRCLPVPFSSVLVTPLRPRASAACCRHEQACRQAVWAAQWAEWSALRWRDSRAFLCAPPPLPHTRTHKHALAPLSICATAVVLRG